MTPNIIIISGPSGSGKTTLYEKLLKEKNFQGKVVRSISCTTRSKRSGERHGRDYFFISPKMFEYKIRAGHFLEWEKVYDNYYGTPSKYVKDQLKKGKNVLLAIDVKGAKTVARKQPKALKIFVKTPSLKVLKQRLKSRGSEGKKAYQKRLETALKELKEEKAYDHTIVNDRLDSAYRRLKLLLKETL